MTYGTLYKHTQIKPHLPVPFVPLILVSSFTECLILVTCLCRLENLKTGSYKGWWHLDKSHVKNTQL